METGHRFAFAKGTRSLCDIIVPSLGSEAVGHAAAVLRGAIADIAGASIPVLATGTASGKRPSVEFGLLSAGSELGRFLQDQGVVAVSDVDLVRSSTASTHTFLAEDLGAQGFVIYGADTTGGRKLTVAANTGQGCLYGACALADRLQWRDGELVVEGLHTRHLPVVNIPAFETRSVATNIGGPDWLGNNQWEREWERDGEYDYRGFVDWLAGHRINQVIIWPFDLAFGIAYASDRFPECVNPYHPNVKHEFIGPMIDYAHERHISVFFFVDFPDNWTAIVKAHPDLAGKNVDVDGLLNMDPSRWETYQRHGRVGSERLRAAYSWVCASNPDTMRFWEGYFHELLERYPSVDGVGGQFEEHQAYRCDCKGCTDGFFELQWRFFNRMCEIAARRIPDVKFWAYRSWGARDIWQNRSQLPGDLIWVDWGSSAPAFATRRSVPRGDWYLYHRSKEQWYEFGLKQAAEHCLGHGLRGLQIRGVQYRELDRMYKAFAEFSWDPHLGLEDYARAYVIGRTRRVDAALAQAYALWIRARGLRELAEYDRAWPEWQREEDYQARSDACLAELTEQLADLAPSEFASELMDAVTELTAGKARAG